MEAMLEIGLAALMGKEPEIGTGLDRLTLIGSGWLDLNDRPKPESTNETVDALSGLTWNQS